MEDTVDFTKICRSCLSDSGPFKDLFLVCTPEMYKYCTSVEVIYHVLKNEEVLRYLCNDVNLSSCNFLRRKNKTLCSNNSCCSG